MKLHLPSRLRAALLVCLSAFTALPTTLGTGSIALGTVGYLLASPEAHAGYSYDESTNAGTFSGTDNADLITKITGNPSKLIFDMESTGTTNWANTGTIAQDLQIGTTDTSKGLCLNNGNAGTTITLSGTITGSGVISKTGAGTGVTLALTGNVTGFTGAINLSSGNTFTLRFGNSETPAAADSTSATAGVSGTGAISFSGTANQTLLYSYASAEEPVYITNSISSAENANSTLTLQGGASYALTKNVAVSTLNLNGSALSFGAGTTAAVGALRVNGGSISGQGGTLALRQAIANSSALTLGGNLTIDLSSITATRVDDEQNAPTSNGFGNTKDIYIWLTGAGNVTLAEGTSWTFKHGETVLGTISAGDAVPVSWTDPNGTSTTSTVYYVLDADRFDWANTEGASKVMFLGVTYSWGGDVHSRNIVIGAGSTITTTHSGSEAFYGNGNTLTIRGGGKLITTANDAMGWSNQATVVTLLGDSETARAEWVTNGRNTASFVLNLQGHTGISTTATGEVGLDMYGTTINVSGQDNTIAANVMLREGRNATINVAEGGTLNISGRLYHRVGDALNVIKGGAGTLTLSGTNNNLGQNRFMLNGGALEVVHDLTLYKLVMAAGTSVTLADGASLTETSSNLIQSNRTTATFSDGAVGGYLRSVDLAGIHVGSDVTLTLSGITLSGDAISSTESGTHVTYTGNEGPYFLISSLTYDADSMAGRRFVLLQGGELITSDLSVIQDMSSGMGSAVLTDSEGNRLVAFDGDRVLNLTVSTDEASGATIVTGSGNGNVTGNITICGGTYRMSANDDLGVNYISNTDRRIVVNGGATLDLNGKECYYYVQLQEGALLKNSGGTIPTSSRTLPVIELLGDATLQTDSVTTIQKSGSGSDSSTHVPYLKLNNHTLTKTGAEVLNLIHVTQSAGTFEVLEGTLDSNGTPLYMQGNASLLLNSTEGSVHTVTAVHTEGAGGRIRIGAGNTLNSGFLRLNWGKTLEVDGILNISGNDAGGLLFSSNNATSISGSGTLNTNLLTVTNHTQVTLALGSATAGALRIVNANNNTLTLNSAMSITGNATLEGGALTAHDTLSIGGALTLSATAVLSTDTAVTAAGAVTLTSGATLGTSLAGRDEVTYSDGVNGFLTGGKAYIIKGSSISVVNGEGAEAALSTLNFTLDGSAVDAARAGKDTTGLYITIEDASNALYYVNSGTVTMNDHSTATGFVLAKGATLVCKASAAADYAATEGLQSIRSLGGQLNVVNSAGTTNLLTLEGAYSGVTLNSKQDSSIQVLGGTVASGSTAALSVHSGTTLDLNNNGLVQGAAITVESGATVSVNGERRYQGNMLLQGTLVLGRTDALDWGSSGKLTIDGGTVNAGSTRISIDSNNLELHNATINGAGEASYGVLDFASSAQKVVVATGTNTVEGKVRVRGTGGVCFDVQGQTDTLSLKNLGGNNQTSGLAKGTILTKSGLGTLTVREASALATVNVLGGTLKLTGTNDISSTTVADGATLGSTAAGLTLGGALTLQDGAALDVTNGAIALGAADSTQALTWDGCITLVGAGTGSVDLLSGISSITGIDFGSGNTVAAADYIQGASENALLRFTNGTLTFLSSDDSILLVSNAHTYDQADAGNTAVTSIRLAGGTLSMANVAIPSAVTTLDVTAAGGALTGTGTVNTLSFGSVNVNGQLTLQDGATDLTLKTQQLSIGENGSIVLEAGQTLDLTELTPGGAANSGFTRATDALKLTLGKVTGAGSVKLCGATTSIGDDNRIMTRMLSDTATSVAYLSEGALAVNGSNSRVALNIGSSFTVGGEFRLESGAQIKVTTGGALSVDGSINMGHVDVANNSGSLSMSDGSITTDGIGFTRTDHGTGSSFTMSGGTLTINTTAGIASGIGITITGGTLATNGADWGMSNATIGGAAISGANTISLSGSTTLTGTLDNSAGKLALSGNVNISNTDAFQTQTTTTGYSDGAKQGFASQDVNYIIAEDGSAGHLSIAEGTTWTVNSETIGSLVDLDGSKAYRVTGVQGTAFHIGTNEVTYSTIKERTNSAGQGITELVLCGKGLNLDEALANGVTVRLDAASSVIALSSGVSLDKASVTGGDAAHALDLRGSGTYALGSASSLGEGVSLNATEWTGTVSMDSCAGGNLSALGNANSTIAVTGALSGTSVTTASALSVGGSAALTSGASSAKSFNGTDLTLGTATESATLTTTGALSLSGSLTLASVGSSVNVGSVGGTALTLDISSALGGDEGSIANWTLMTLGTASDLVTLAGGTATDTGFTLRGGKDNLYLYTLEWQANGTQLVLTSSTLYGKVWGGNTGDAFDSGNTWNASTTNANTDVIFAGSGSSDVTVNGDADVKDITISGRPADEDYVFKGGAIDASGSLRITAGGGLSIENSTQVAQNGSIATNGSLSIGNGGSLSVDGNLSNEGSLNIAQGGSLSVDGDFSNEGSLSIAQGGSIVLGDDATLKTDAITITNLDLTQGALVTGGKLESLTPGTDITLSLSDDLLTTVLGDADVENSQSYALVNGTELAAELQLDEEQRQAILKSGRLAEIVSGGAATFALRNAAPAEELNLILRQQTANESTWTIGDTTTHAGLVVTDGGKLVSEDILDNVQHVEVNGAQEIDLSGQDASGSELTQLKLNGVSGSGSLALKGDTTDVITITTTDAYTGSLSAESLKLVMNTGAHTTVALGTGTLELGGASTMTGGVLAATLDQAQIAAGTPITLVSGGTLTLNGTTVMLDTTASALALAPDATLTVKLGETVIRATDVTTQLLGTLGKYFGNATVDDQGVLTAERNRSYYSDNFAGSGNSATGIAMADEVLLYGNPQSTAPDSDLAKLLDALDACVATGDSAAAARLSEAFSGASAAAMGAALAGTVESRLESIRNRTTTMGVNQCVVNEDMPYFNAWLNAEGDYRELNSDGSMPGYKLSSWGGTVGFDMDCTPSFTCGLAFSALYGDFDSKGADHATGDLNTYYLTAFARYAKHRWTHTFVATAGLADTSLERTVNGAKVEGDSDGSMLGALYEVGYVFALDEEATTCLQPVFNVAVTHSTLKGYTESGSNVALQVDDTELTRVSFGLGARLQAVVGESVYNRSSILEMRALLKADAGDREGETKVALAGTELPTHSVKSAESGAIGCELGAGLTVPVGDEGGNLFADASVELRADYTNVNATLGYRVNF